jgi:hypothetical protein
MPRATVRQQVTNCLLRGFVKLRKGQRRAREKTQATYDRLSQQLRADRRRPPSPLHPDDSSSSSGSSSSGSSTSGSDSSSLSSSSSGLTSDSEGGEDLDAYEALDGPLADPPPGETCRLAAIHS